MNGAGQIEQATMAVPHGRPSYTVGAEVFIFLYTISYYLHALAVPQLALQHDCYRRFNQTVCVNLGNEKYRLEQDIVQNHVATWMSAILVAQFLPSMLGLLVWGPLIDVIGTQSAMIIPPVLLSVQAIYYMVFSYFKGLHPLYLMFGSCVTSFYGDFSGCSTVAYSYVSQQHNNDARSKRMALLEGTFVVAGVVAGLTGGIVMNQVGFTGQFIYSLILCLLNVLHSICVVYPWKMKRKTATPPPIDTNQSKNLTRHRLKEVLNPYRHLLCIWNVIKTSKTRKQMLLVFAVYFCTCVATSGEAAMSVLYLKHSPFSFTATEIGLMLAYVSFIRGVGVVVSTFFFMRICKFKDSVVMCIGLISLCLVHMLIGLSSTRLMLYLVSLTGFCAVAPIVMCRSMTSKLAVNHVGATLAALEVVGAASGITTALVATRIYSEAVSFFPGNVFLVFAGVSFVGFCIALYTHYQSRPYVQPMIGEQSPLLSSATL